MARKVKTRRKRANLGKKSRRRNLSGGGWPWSSKKPASPDRALEHIKARINWVGNHGQIQSYDQANKYVTEYKARQDTDPHWIPTPFDTDEYNKAKERQKNFW